jgi:hypothetical protein
MIRHPDLGDHRLYHNLALRRRSIRQGALDIPDELGGVRDARLTDVLPEPPLLEGLEVAIQRSLGS